MVTRTAKGTGAAKAPGTSWTAIASVTVTDGATLVVDVGYVLNSATTVSVAWNGTSVPAATTARHTSPTGGQVFVLGDATGGTGDIVVTFGSGPSGAVCIATQYEGVAASPVNQVASASGSGSTPNSGDTATTTQDACAIHGFWTVNEDDAPANGSPAAGSEADTDGQSATTSGGGSPATEAHGREFFGAITSAAAVNAARTGAQDAPWSCHVVALTEAAGSTYSLTVEPTSYAVAGADAALQTSRLASASPSTTTLTGAAASLDRRFTLAADPAAITLTGITATPRVGRALSASPGTLTLTAGDVGLARHVGLSVDPSAVTVTSTAATPRASRVLEAAPGAMSVAGATTTLEAHVQQSVAADPAAYALTGIAARLQVARRATVNPASVALTGAPMTCVVSRALSCAPSTVEVSGLLATMTAITSGGGGVRMPHSITMTGVG